MSTTHTINDVSRLSGIPKDLLRQWERRYGYPDPERNMNGDRRYSTHQLDKLTLIRQLLDQGKRPGKLIGLDTEQLRKLLSEPGDGFDGAHLLALLKSGDQSGLGDWLQRQVLVHGLRSFIHRVMSPATTAVGNAWAEGELDIHQEHLYTEAVKRVVRRELSEQTPQSSEPRVMLTSVPGEQHSLGLLMVEALLHLGGAKPIAFGTEMPFQEIRKAAESHQVQVIALSFSSCIKDEDALVMLSGLRQIIAPEIAIWVGGASFRAKPNMPAGVDLVEDLWALESVLGSWKRPA